ETIAGRVRSQELCRDNSYGDSLTADMTKLGTQLSDEIAALVDRHAQDHGLSPISPSAVARLRQLLQSEHIRVVVPDPPVPKKAVVGVVGAVIGGIVGTLVGGPGPGTAIGAAL